MTLSNCSEMVQVHERIHERSNKTTILEIYLGFFAKKTNLSEIVASV